MVGARNWKLGGFVQKIDVICKSRQSLLSKRLIFEIILITYDHIQILQHLWGEISKYHLKFVEQKPVEVFEHM